MANSETVVHVKLPGETLDLADKVADLLREDLTHKNQGKITRTYTIRHALLVGLRAVAREYHLESVGLKDAE